jgi:hypothetical protein
LIGFQLRVGDVILEGIGHVVEHEAAAIFVQEHAAFAAHTFRYKSSAHGERPDHTGWVKLHELHVHEFGAESPCKGLTVAGIFPRIGGDRVNALPPPPVAKDD